MEKKKLSDDALEQVTGGAMGNEIKFCTCNCEDTYLENGNIICKQCGGIKQGNNASKPQANNPVSLF